MKTLVNYRALGDGGGREANRSMTAKKKASNMKTKMSRDSSGGLKMGKQDLWIVHDWH